MQEPTMPQDAASTNSGAAGDDLGALSQLNVYCSRCGRQVLVSPEDVGQVVECPHCRGDFVVPEGGTPVAAPVVVERVFADPAEALEFTEAPPEDEELERRQREELDSIRIRQVAHASRSAYRQRSYFIIAAIGLLAIAGQFLWWLFTQIRDSIYLYHHGKWHWGMSLKPASSLIIALFCLRWIPFCLRKAHDYYEEAMRTELDEPEGEPDFTPLNDGGQYARSLEELHKKSAEG